eukprot:scaffold2263_cov272-Pinguiococcus_pyrenoidosus.AAC.3
MASRRRKAPSLRVRSPVGDPPKPTSSLSPSGAQAIARAVLSMTHLRRTARARILQTLIVWSSPHVAKTDGSFGWHESPHSSPEQCPSASSTMEPEALETSKTSDPTVPTRSDAMCDPLGSLFTAIAATPGSTGVTGAFAMSKERRFLASAVQSFAHPSWLPVANPWSHHAMHIASAPQVDVAAFCTSDAPRAEAGPAVMRLQFPGISVYGPPLRHGTALHFPELDMVSSPSDYAKR